MGGYIPRRFWRPFDLMRPFHLAHLFFMAAYLQTQHQTSSPPTPDFGDWTLIQEVEDLHLNASLAVLKRLQKKSRDQEDFQPQADELRDLRDRLQDELASVTAFVLDPADSALMLGAHPFGDEVGQSFPSMTYDIQEAARCLALDRATACVFHLMRVVELALRVFYKSLGLPEPRSRNWEALLQPIREEAQKDPKDRSSAWRANAEFNARTNDRLQAVKDAWRNPTMHVGEKYTETEARDVYESVARLMRQLAAKLHE